jgi:hypothetical protein
MLPQHDLCIGVEGYPCPRSLSDVFNFRLLRRTAGNFELMRVFIERRIHIKKLQSFNLISNPIQLSELKESKINDCDKTRRSVKNTM